MTKQGSETTIPKTCYQNLLQFTGETQNCIDRLTQNTELIKHLCTQILNGRDLEIVVTYNKDIDKLLEENVKLCESILGDFKFLIEE